MKKQLIMLSGCLLWGIAGAVSLDGTATVIVQAGTYAFAGGDYARGAVRLDGGMTIPAGGSVSFNLLFALRGPVTLNGTGTVVLEGDMAWDTGTTLVDSGNLDGQGNALVLRDDVRLQAGVSLTCISDTIIDGQGHALTFEPGAPGGQLIIDGPAGTTVTLRNITLHGVADYSALVSSIQFGANADQVLVLDNVMLHLADDFTFQGGSFIAKGMTSIHGKYTFFYRSPVHSFIADDSTLLIDLGTVFHYEPADANPAHIRFSNRAARLWLLGSRLVVPNTVGLKLFNGHLIIDHFVTLQNDNATVPNQGIELGVCGGNDMDITILPAATLHVASGVLTYGNNDFAP